MHMPHGAHVTIKPGFDLAVSIGDARFAGRFLFLPSSLCAGDAVWLRIERAPGRAVDISARVACVVTARNGRNGGNGRNGRSAWRPLPGACFIVTIDKVTAARPLETTRARYAPGDDDDEVAPTEPNRTRSWAQTAPDSEGERTTPDQSAVHAVFTATRGA